MGERPSPDVYAHHIVPIEHKDFEKLQEKLANDEIKGNDAINGAWVNEKYHLGYVHGGGSKKYLEYINERLGGLDDDV